MSYDYKVEREKLFTDAGSRKFLRVRDKVKELIALSGAVRSREAVLHESSLGYELIACLDRMVELGEIAEVTGPKTIQQYRVFVGA